MTVCVVFCSISAKPSGYRRSLAADSSAVADAKAADRVVGGAGDLGANERLTCDKVSSVTRRCCCPHWQHSLGKAFRRESMYCAVASAGHTTLPTLHHHRFSAIIHQAGLHFSAQAAPHAIAYDNTTRCAGRRESPLRRNGIEERQDGAQARLRRGHRRREQR